MQKIELFIHGLSYSQSQPNSYALILGEMEGKRRLPIVIGHNEAQSIALEIEKMKPARPLTHDLFKSFADAFRITIEEVIINKFHEGIFHALIICSDGTNRREIDSRTSDAVALAVRFGCRIYTYENIMAQAGIILEENPEAEELSPEDELRPSGTGDFSSYSLTELEEMLHSAIENEEYEKASLIRDEINKRK